ncbi:baseplate protein [Vibrio phage PS15B-6]
MARTIKEISNSIISQLESVLNQKIPPLQKSFMRAHSQATASVFVMLEHYGVFMTKQQFVAVCSDKPINVQGKQLTPLVEWGNLIGVAPQKAGQRAEHTISVTVEQLGGTLDAGTQLQSSQNGFTYITTQAYILNTNPIEITIKAADDPTFNNGIGANGNLANGAEVSFVNPLAEVGKIATVTGQLVTGADPETTASYRKRVQKAFRRRKQGGAYIDYQLWGEEVDGISNVYPYTCAPMEVDVYAEATVASSGDPDGIPTPTQLQEVYDSIEFDQNGKASRRPVGVFVNVFPISRTGFTVFVAGLSVSNQAQIQQQIEEGLADYFLDAEPFITGLSVPPRSDVISKIAVEGVINDIVRANNGDFIGALIYKYQDGAPVDPSYQLGTGEKAKLVSISFV